MKIVKEGKCCPFDPGKILVTAIASDGTWDVLVNDCGETLVTVYDSNCSLDYRTIAGLGESPWPFT